MKGVRANDVYVIGVRRSDKDVGLSSHYIFITTSVLFFYSGRSHPTVQMI